MKRFIVDAQLPTVLATALREAGYDAQAVRELGLRDAEDSEIWESLLVMLSLPEPLEIP